MPPKKTDTDQIENLRDDFRADVIALHSKSDSINKQLAEISGELKGTLPFLATKTDVEQNMSKHVKDYHGPKSGRSTPPQQAQQVAQESKGIDPKLIAGLIGAATLLISAISAVLQRFLATL